MYGKCFLMRSARRRPTLEKRYEIENLTWLCRHNAFNHWWARNPPLTTEINYRFLTRSGRMDEGFQHRRINGRVAEWQSKQIAVSNLGNIQWPIEFWESNTACKMVDVAL